MLVTGAGQVDEDAAKHLPLLVSQHCVPPDTAGQLFWQSASDLQLVTHCFAGGAAGGADGGIVVVVVSGSVGCCSCAMSESEEAQATMRRLAEKTERMELA